MMQKLYNIHVLLDENSMILFYNNNFMIYYLYHYIILSDFDNLQLDKILKNFI